MTKTTNNLIHLHGDPEHGALLSILSIGVQLAQRQGWQLLDKQILIMDESKISATTLNALSKHGCLDDADPVEGVCAVEVSKLRKAISRFEQTG